MATIKKINNLAFFVILGLLIQMVSCTYSSAGGITETAENVSVTDTLDVSIPGTTTIAPTVIPTMTQTLPSTKTMTPTQTTVLIETFVPLTDEQRTLYLLENPHISDLPCVYGFSVSQTVNQAVNYAEYLGLIPSQYSGGLGETMEIQGMTLFTEEHGYITNQLTLYLDEEDIHAMRFSSETSNISFFQQYWSFLDPSVILNQFGTPSRVLLNSDQQGFYNSDNGFDISFRYHIFLAYDDLGFMIIYQGQELMRLTDVEERYCPFFGSDGNLSYAIQLYVIDENSPLSFEDWSLPAHATPLDQVTNMDIDQFVELITSGENCFYVDENVWGE